MANAHQKTTHIHLQVHVYLKINLQIYVCPHENCMSIMVEILENAFTKPYYFYF